MAGLIRGRGDLLLKQSLRRCLVVDKNLGAARKFLSYKQHDAASGGLLDSVYAHGRSKAQAYGDVLSQLNALPFGRFRILTA